MKHMVKNIFHSGIFVVGFIRFVSVFLFSLYPLFSMFDPMEMVGSGFHAPGSYYNINSILETKSADLNHEVSAGLSGKFSEEQLAAMKDWLVNFGGVSREEAEAASDEEFIKLWNACYDSAAPQKGLLATEKRDIRNLDEKIKALQSSSGAILAEENEDGELEKKQVIGPRVFVRGGDVANSVTFPLGTDNFGADVLTKLASAVGVSLRIGLIAGLVATAIGLIIGLVAGFLGGWVDNLLTFFTNLFTVIPSFVILVLIANSVSQAGRGPSVVAVIIGVTAWPWTARSVRSQVISLRNRDHVNLSKLSGHSLPRIIFQDILPYVASYVVMALILQISSGILAEAQLSMLGLGPSTSNVTTLGLMMQWANKFSAHTQGFWWAFLPVILSITVISFSLNLMNTGLDQVFNPQLRD